MAQAQAKQDISRAENFPRLKQYEVEYPWRDRRSGFDRRQLKGQNQNPSSLEQRSGKDRRCSRELPETIQYRRARTQLRIHLKAYQASCAPKTRVIGTVALVMAALLGGIITLSPMMDRISCGLLPRPGADWSNCFLSGKTLAAADLSGANLHNSSLKGADLRQASLASAILTYASLASADLRHANLSGASLRGANLRDADLGNAKLDHADLSYADLSGANLDGVSLQGAKLDYAIWPDRRECAPGSMGFCQ